MEITKIPHKVLANKTASVAVADIKNGSLKELISDMKNAMAEHQGVGLAANQIGRDLSIFVIEPRLAADAAVPEVYINPEITEYSEETDRMEEGCLSIPDFFVLIERSKKIKIKFVD